VSRATVRLVALVVGAVSLAACTSDASPGPTTTPSSPGPRPTDSPPISRPLDASRYGAKDRICELFTQEQANNLGFPDDYTAPHSTESAASCVRGSVGLSPAQVSYMLSLIENPLETTYNLSKTYDQFVPRTISRQPAVQVWANGSDPPRRCEVVVGFAEQQGVEIQVSHEARNACDVAVAVAEHVVRNLGG
jgi:hypothetical protein